MNLCQYFPHLLSSLAEIWCKRSEHESVENFEFCDNWLREGILFFFFMGVNEIKFMCVM
jgi:hypothetical protein